MTSLATLAHTTPPPPAFNGLFYATAATVIPVLFLAIAVQGRAYETLIRAMGTSGTDSRRAKRSAFMQADLRIMLYGSASATILTYGAAGEIVAMLALATQADMAESFVGSAVVFLTAATAAGPAVALWRSWTSALRAADGSPSKPGTTEPPGETGKTDTEG